MMRSGLVTCVLLLSVGSFGFAQSATQQPTVKPGAGSEQVEARRQVSPSKEAKIRELLALTGVQETVKVSMDGMQKSMRPLLSNSLPPGEYREQLIDLFLQRFREKATPTVMIDMIIPTYDKYFSDEELGSLLAFYKTPVGSKALAVLPKVVAEAQENGRVWGRELGKQSMAEVLDEHPDLKKALEEATLKSHVPQP
jgi:hypothetical protein